MATFAVGLASVRVRLPRRWEWLRWPGSPDAATALLQTIAASVITVTALTFSLTVLALQLASQQFSPRLLRDFAHDRVIKAVLAVQVSTLVFTATVLREISADRSLPHVSLLVAAVLGLVALTAVLGFITHMVRVLRVDTMMRTVHAEADRAIAAFYPRYGDSGPRDPGDLERDRGAGVQLYAATSGFVRVIDVAPLVRAAHSDDALVRVEVRPGDHVVRGTPIATVWSSTADLTALRGAVHRHVQVGYERTAEQDAAFGFRQLTDIAVKAVSPGINDPVTAVHSIGHASDLLVKLAGRRLGATLHEDSQHTGRVMVPDRDLRYYLDLVCGQIRRYARDEPTVLVALLRMLRDLATAARDEQQKQQIAQQVQLIVAEAPHSMAGYDAAQVTDMGERVSQALRGDVRTAYADRAGETRSL